MTNAKFKYYFKDTQGKFSTMVWTLEQIERGDVQYFQDAHMPILPEIVARCQWTGFDNIFEGDIIKNFSRVIEIRKREDGRWDLNQLLWLKQIVLDKEEECKIIGNTITNPDLLGDGK